MRDMLLHCAFPHGKNDEQKMTWNKHWLVELERSCFLFQGKKFVAGTCRLPLFFLLEELLIPLTKAQWWPLNITMSSTFIRAEAQTYIKPQFSVFLFLLLPPPPVYKIKRYLKQYPTGAIHNATNISKFCSVLEIKCSIPFFRVFRQRNMNLISTYKIFLDPLSLLISQKHEE